VSSWDRGLGTTDSTRRPASRFWWQFTWRTSTINGAEDLYAFYSSALVIELVNLLQLEAAAELRPHYPGN